MGRASSFSQGGRYAEGQWLQAQAQARYPVLDDISRLLVNEPGSNQQIDALLERVNKLYLAHRRCWKWKVRAIQLIAFCSHPELQ